MPETERGKYLIAYAWSLHGDALEMLSQGRLRNAAEKAWGATKRATDALILERTGREPIRTSQTSSGLRALARLDLRLILCGLDSAVKCVISIRIAFMMATANPRTLELA